MFSDNEISELKNTWYENHEKILKNIYNEGISSMSGRKAQDGIFESILQVAYENNIKFKIFKKSLDSGAEVSVGKYLQVVLGIIEDKYGKLE